MEETETQKAEEDENNARLQSVLSDSAIEKSVARDLTSQFGKMLQSMIDEKRSLFVALVRERLAQAGPLAASEANLESDVGWVEIQSLSRLRSVVGGRFQNLKRKWTSAGLPLREHRGDHSSDFEIDETGWLELCDWISRQGYEARLDADQTESLFEVRKRELSK